MKYALVIVAAVAIAVGGYFASKTDVRVGLTSSTEPTVGETLYAADMKPATPATAAPPPAWTSRVLFKGCGQNVSVRMRIAGRLLLYNGGTVNRYTRGTPFPVDATAPPAYSRTIVPRDHRLVTWNQTGVYVFTFTTPYCTLWSPKIVVTVTG